MTLNHKSSILVIDRQTQPQNNLGNLKMRSNTKIVADKIKQHIIDSVYDKDENTYTSIELAATHLYNEFCRVSSYSLNLQRYPNTQNRFKDYMQGIPFLFLISYCDITDFLNSLDINPTNRQYSTTQTEDLYYNLIYREVIKYKVD